MWSIFRVGLVGLFVFVRCSLSVDVFHFPQLSSKRTYIALQPSFNSSKGDKRKLRSFSKRPVRSLGRDGVSRVVLTRDLPRLVAFPLRMTDPPTGRQARMRRETCASEHDMCVGTRRVRRNTTCALEHDVCVGTRLVFLAVVVRACLPASEKVGVLCGISE